MYTTNMVFIGFLVFFGVLTNMALGVPFAHSGHTPRIIGGVDAPEAYSSLHMAALIFGERVQFLLCGGSIITKSLILTAAHCIDGFILKDGGLMKSLHALVGSNKWNSGGTVARFDHYYMHPQWDPKLIKYDAGVLVLKEKLTLTDTVAIIGLSYDFVEGNEKSFVTGWGRTGPRVEGDVVHMAPTPDELQLLYVNTISHDECQQQMSSVSNNTAPDIQRDVEICTFHSYKHGMCSGDSGSGLVRLSTRQQIGIVSWGYNCADGAPDIYVRLYGIRDFVEPIMNIHQD